MVSHLIYSLLTRYSRIPVYDESHPHAPIRGLLLVKDLILIDPSDEIPIATLLSFYGRRIQTVSLC